MANQDRTQPLIFDRPATCWKESGYGKTTYYKRIAEGLEVPPIRIGKRAKGTPRHEREAVAKAKLREATDDEIREIVRHLIAARKAAT